MHFKFHVTKLNQPNELSLYKIQTATLFGCHNEGTLYHYLQTGYCLKKESAHSDLKEVLVVLNLKTSINFSPNDETKQSLLVTNGGRHRTCKCCAGSIVCTVYSCVQRLRGTSLLAAASSPSVRPHRTTRLPLDGF